MLPTFLIKMNKIFDFEYIFRVQTVDLLEKEEIIQAKIISFLAWIVEKITAFLRKRLYYPNFKLF